MAPTLPSPSGRMRSRTSDLSDFLRGRHDTKTSMESPSRLPSSQIPPVPRLSPSTAEPAPVTPPKIKSKFGFLGRKRKPSFSPSSSKADASAASAAAHANANATALRRELDNKQVPPVPVPSQDRDTGNQPTAAGPSVRPAQASDHQRAPASGIPVPQSASPFRPNGVPTPNTHFSPYGPTPNLVNNIRKQKGSFESTRRSTDSRSSTRPIITVSPPHSNIHEGEHAYTAPRSAPLPAGQSSPQRSQTSLPTPSASDRTTTPDSPSSVDVPSPATSTHSVVQSVIQLPQLPDEQSQSAISYKEETLLRKNHFDVGDTQPRRGTVSCANNQPAPATVGFSPNRMERRHISVVQLSRLKKEIIATAPKIRKMPSESSSIGQQRDLSPKLGRSNTISISPPRSPNSDQSSPQAQAQGSNPRSQQAAGKRVPPPLKRTWHTPPTTGPPKEPLPSPPASATRATPTPTTSDSFRTAPPSPASPFSPRRALPPLVPPKDALPSSMSRAQGAMSPADSVTSLSLSVPPSPARSFADADTGRDTPSGRPSPTTPVREDPARRVLADENATAQELRDALLYQVDKYKRLSSYLLSLTERHALERAELMGKVELLEQDKERRERELKGLKWLVAHGRDGREAPARSDSGVMPGTRLASLKSKRDRSGSAATSRGVASISGSDGRMSLDSQAGSVEEGLFELQTTISEFIAPETEQAAGAPSVRESITQGPSTASADPRARRRMRSNTVPNKIGGASAIPSASVQAAPAAASRIAQSTRIARRTSSPVLPSTGSSDAPAKPPPGVSAMSTSGRTGLGLGVGLDGASSLKSFSRSPSPDSRVDLHARSDSSTLSSLPSLSTIHSSSPSSVLSSIPETPRTDVAMLHDDAQAPLAANRKDVEEHAVGANVRRLSTSSTSSSVSGTGSGISGGSSRVSASPSIGQVLDKTKSKNPSGSHHQPEMEAILRRLRVFGQGHSQ